MNALIILIDQIITIYLYTLIAYVILTLLIQYDLVNRNNSLVYKILRGLIALHEPLLIQIRKRISLMNGVIYLATSKEKK